MSDSWQGPGWWKAQDGKWYPPELHPTGSPLHGKPTSGSTTLVTVLAAVGLLSLLLLGGCVASLALFARSSGDVFEELERLDLEQFGDGDGRNGPIVVALDGCSDGEVPGSMSATGEAIYDEDAFTRGEVPNVVDVEFVVQFIDLDGGVFASTEVVVEGLRRGESTSWTGKADGDYLLMNACKVTGVRWVE